jgi:hypothetical protein
MCDAGSWLVSPVVYQVKLQTFDWVMWWLVNPLALMGVLSSMILVKQLLRDGLSALAG